MKPCPTSRAALIGLLASIPLAASCWTTTSERTASHPQPFVVRAAPRRAWNVLEQERLLGMVILFEAADDPGNPIYMVRNAWHHDLGMIDRLGRAWRYQPHEAEAEWVSTGTVLEGASRILGAREECRLEEVTVPAIGMAR